MLKWGLVVLSTLLTASLSYLWFFHVNHYYLEGENGWTFGVDHLPQVELAAAQNQRPMLLYFRKTPCTDCDIFEREYLTQEPIVSQIRPWYKLTIELGDDLRSRELMEIYHITRLPTMALFSHPGKQPMRMHVVLLKNQQLVWVPKNSYLQGTYMPLSSNTLSMAFTRSLELSLAGHFSDLKKGAKDAESGLPPLVE